LIVFSISCNQKKEPENDIQNSEEISSFLSLDDDLFEKPVITDYQDLPGTFWVEEVTDTTGQPLMYNPDGYIFLRDNMVLIVKTSFNRFSYDNNSPLFYKGTYSIIGISKSVNFHIQNDKLYIDYGNLQGILKDGFLFMGFDDTYWKYKLESSFSVLDKDGTPLKDIFNERVIERRKSD
jgi:hypothetical protein